MPTATVLVQGKSEPERGKKRGRIKSDSGMVFQADPILLRQVNVGSTYEFDYRDDSFTRDDGEVIKFRVIEKIRVGVTAPSTPTPSVGSEQSHSEFDLRGEEIGAGGIIKCMGVMPVDREEVYRRMKEAALGLRKFRNWQKLGPQTAKEEMDDEIPDLQA